MSTSVSPGVIVSCSSLAYRSGRLRPKPALSRRTTRPGCARSSVPPSASVAGNDASLIGERAATRGAQRWTTLVHVLDVGHIGQR
jgi:hypothetical protein